MSEIEKMKRYIARTKMNNNDGFCMNVAEAFELAHQAYNVDDLPIEAISLAFKYGKAKGYRAAKAEKKAKEAVY